MTEVLLLLVSKGVAFPCGKQAVWLRHAQLIGTDVKYEVCLRQHGVLSVEDIPKYFTAYLSSMVRIYQEARVVIFSRR